MGGILKFLPVEEAAVAAIRAGSDLLEICHSPELILRSYDALVSEGERSAAFRKVLMATARDAARKRARLYARGVAPPLSAKRLESLRKSISQFNETMALITESGSRRNTACGISGGSVMKLESNDRGRSHERNVGRWNRCGVVRIAPAKGLWPR